MASARMSSPSGEAAAPAGRAEKASWVDIFSLSSKITRWAVFFPSPGTLAREFSLPVTMAAARSAGLMADNAARATLGPTRETEMSWRNMARSSFV